MLALTLLMRESTEVPIASILDILKLIYYVLEQLMAKKKDGSLPSGQVPTLTIDGSKLISQSTAIIRFVGKYGKGDLYPSDPFQAAQVCLL